MAVALMLSGNSSSPDGNTTADANRTYKSSRETPAADDPVYFETAIDTGTVAIHESGRVYVRYNGTTNFQEVSPSAPLYGFFAYMIMHRKAQLHGRDDRFNSVLVNIDTLSRPAGTESEELEDQIPDADRFTQCDEYGRLRKAVRTIVSKYVLEEYGLPIDQSGYADWEESLQTKWLEFTRDVRSSMEPYGRSYLHRLTSEYAHERLFEDNSRFMKAVEAYSYAVISSYSYYRFSSLHSALVELLQEDARAFNRSLYGLGSAPEERPSKTSVSNPEPRQPTHPLPPPRRAPNGGEREPARQPERRDPNNSPNPGSKVSKEEDSADAGEEGLVETEPAGPKQGELTVVEMADRLDKLDDLADELTGEELNSKLKEFGRSWCRLKLEVLGKGKPTISLDDEEALILRFDPSVRVDTLVTHLSPTWVDPATDERVQSSHADAPQSLYSILRITDRTVKKLNALNTEDTSVKRYFYPSSDAGKLEEGDYVTAWFTLDCSSGQVVRAYHFLESPRAGDAGGDADEGGSQPGDGRKQVPARLAADEVSIDGMIKMWNDAYEIWEDPDLSIRKRDREIKALGEAWCYVAYRVTGTKEITERIDEEVANASGLDTWTWADAIEIEVSVEWYDPRTGRNAEVEDSQIRFVALKGVSASRLSELNDVVWNFDDRVSERRFWLDYDVAADMKRGDGVVTKYIFDCTSGERQSWRYMTQLAPRKQLQD